jgi:5-bromo-4-chloroindolyl phosphate hydrolysis protein
MTKEQAIQILEQATGELKLSRKDHLLVQEALQTLAKKEDAKE